MRKIVNMTPVEAAKFSEADAGKQKKSDNPPREEVLHKWLGGILSV